MTESIIWAVVWGVLVFVAPGVIVLVTMLLSGGIGAAVSKQDREAGGIVGAIGGQFLGYILAVAFMIFAAVQCVLMIINAVNGV